MRQRRLPPPPHAFFIYAPEKTAFTGAFAVSPNGRSVVFRVSSEGKVLLWMRALDSLTTQPLAGMEEAIYPFWSPDSRFVGFSAGGKLKKIEVTGGPAQTLCDAGEGRGGAWNGEGVIVFTPRDAEGLYRVPAAGGAPVPLTSLDASRQEISHFTLISCRTVAISCISPPARNIRPQAFTSARSTQRRRRCW